MPTILLFLLFMITSASAIMPSIAMGQSTKQCIAQRVEKMLTYNCLDLRLKEVPQYMSSGVEILGLSENRIRDLTVESFRKYTGLKLLYLSENMIQTVETGTFEQLSQLEVLDLSSNALTTLPLEVFYLARLRTLYVADNNLFHIEADLQNLRRPILAPLSTMSFSSCKLLSIPDLGVLPYLQHVNYSYNPMINIDPIQLAPMCSLKTIDLKGTHMPGCACRGIESHLQSANVFVKNGPIHCDRSGPECTITAGNSSQQLYMECMTNKQSRIQEEMKSSILIYAAIGGGCLLVVLIICCCCIRNKKIAAKRKKEKRAAAARRKARRMDDEHRLMIKAEQNSQEDKCTKKDSNVIQVDIEKVPRID